MELIEWSDRFSTGIPGIDAEHQELIESINAFYARQSQDASREELSHSLDDIYATIHAHFMLEERLMERYGYDEYPSHRDDHARLLDDLRDISMLLEQQDRFDEQHLRDKLNDWFMLHFKTHDSRLHKLEQLIAEQKNSSTGLLNGLKKIRDSLFGNK